MGYSVDAMILNIYKQMYNMLLFFCSGFTPNATSDIQLGLVEDGTKCGIDSMCYEQGCVTVSSLGFPQCPTGFNGIICSGNGVNRI